MTRAIIVTGVVGDGTPGGSSIVYADPVGGGALTVKVQELFTKRGTTSEALRPNTVVHWPPMSGAAASLSITGSSTYFNPSRALPHDAFSRQQNPVAAVIAGIDLTLQAHDPFVTSQADGTEDNHQRK